MNLNAIVNNKTYSDTRYAIKWQVEIMSCTLDELENIINQIGNPIMIQALEDHKEGKPLPLIMSEVHPKNDL